MYIVLGPKSSDTRSARKRRECRERFRRSSNAGSASFHRTRGNSATPKQRDDKALSAAELRSTSSQKRGGGVAVESLPSYYN